MDLTYDLLVATYYSMLLNAAGITSQNKWTNALASPNTPSGSYALLQLAQTMARYQIDNVNTIGSI